MEVSFQVAFRTLKHVSYIYILFIYVLTYVFISVLYINVFISVLYLNKCVLDFSIKINFFINSLQFNVEYDLSMTLLKIRIRLLNENKNLNWRKELNVVFFCISTVSCSDLRLSQHLFFFRDHTPIPRPTTRAHPAATGTRVIVMSCEDGAMEGVTFELKAGPSTLFISILLSMTELRVLLSVSLLLCFVFSSSSFVVSGYCFGSKGGKDDGKLGKCDRPIIGGRMRPSCWLGNGVLLKINQRNSL